MKLNKYLILLYIVFLVFESTRFTSFNVGFIQVSAIDLILLFLFSRFIIDITVTGKIYPTPFAFTIFKLMFIVFLISLIPLVYISSSFIFYDYKITLNFLEHAALIIIFSQIIREKSYLKVVLFTLCLCALAASFITVLISLGVPFPGDFRSKVMRIGPVLIGIKSFIEQGGTNLKGFILFSFPFALKDKVIKYWPLRFIFALTLLLACIVMGDRSFWLSILLQIIIFMVYYSIFSKISYWKLMMLSITILFIAILALNSRVLYSGIVNIRPQTFESRIEGYIIGVKLATSNPLHLLFGAGKGMFVEIVNYNMVPHNFFLDLLVSKGLITLVLVLLMLCLIISKLIKIIKTSRIEKNTEKEAYAILLLISLAGFFSDAMSTSMVNSKTLWTTIALTCAFISICQKSRLTFNFKNRKNSSTNIHKSFGR